MAPACKEWAAVVHALLEGEQILDVRKGGLREDGRHFSVQSTRFWLYPTAESVAIAEALRRIGRPVSHANLTSSAGHDAFLVDGEAQAPLIEEFLAAL